MGLIAHSNSLNLGLYDTKTPSAKFYSRKSSTESSIEKRISRSLSNSKVLINISNEANDEFTILFKKTWGDLVKRLCISFLIFASVVIIQAFFISIVEIGYDSSISPLTDRVHYAFDISDTVSFYIVDILILTFGLIALLRTTIFVPTFQSIVHLIRILLILSVGYLIRGIFISATTVPSATRNCIPGSVNSNNKILSILAGNFGLSLTCTDNIISGHTFLVTIVYLLLVEVENRLIPRMFLTIYYFTICFLIIITRAHYTIDVLFGFFYGLILYNMYKMLLKDRISQIYDWSKTPFFIPKQLQCSGLGAIVGSVIGWFEVIDQRLKLIRLDLQYGTDYHKKIMGIVENDEFNSVFDIVTSKNMCNTLSYINISLFYNFVRRNCNKLFFKK